MTAFDSDVLSDLFKQVPAIVLRTSGIPAAEQCIPIVVAEELLRGQLDGIRRAQGIRGPVSLDVAYGYLAETVMNLRHAQFLAYTSAVDALFQGLRNVIPRVGSNDLRIAAICIIHGAKLVTRNARDYSLVPGLNLEIWN